MQLMFQSELSSEYLREESQKRSDVLIHGEYPWTELLLCLVGLRLEYLTSHYFDAGPHIILRPSPKIGNLSFTLEENMDKRATRARRGSMPGNSAYDGIAA